MWYFLAFLTVIGVLHVVIKSEWAIRDDSNESTLVKTLDRLSADLDRVLDDGYRVISKQSIYELVSLFAEMRNAECYSAGMDSQICELQESVAKDNVSLKVLDEVRSLLSIMSSSQFLEELSNSAVNKIVWAMEKAKRAGYISMVDVIE